MFWQRKTSYLREFTGEIRHYRQIIIISYFPPSQHFGARKDVNSRGIIQQPIVLIELVLATSSKLYRWNRSGMIEAIDQATITQDWSHIFGLAQTDIQREVERKLLHWWI